MSDEGFLARWSRRKRGAEPDAPEAEAAPEAPPAACPIPDLPEIDLASLPRIEELTAESDFGLFLRPGIPAVLRNAALRRMWSLDPAIRDYIGPVEYQWDFNAPGGLPFGFANELAGDIGKLLAQAIGKLEELAEEKIEDANEQASLSHSIPAPQAGGSEPDEVLLPACRDALGGDGPVEASEPPGQVSAEPEPRDAAPPRRRHGSALPS